MQNRNRKPSANRARRAARQRRQRLLLLGGALGVVLALAVLAIILPKGGSRTVTAAAPTPTPSPEIAGEAEMAPEPTPAPTPESVGQRAAVRPTATAPGFLPVFKSGKTNEKIVCITVDDCNQADNLQQIIDAALAVGGKLTIFPIGENVVKPRIAAILKYAWENGFELENHTYTHNGLYRCSDDELVKEIFYQQQALCQALGVEYQCHFIRPAGGDARNDQRIHQYASQLGYLGIAHWSMSGRAGNSTLVNDTGPGTIYLFHTTDTDLNKLLKFIPWLDRQGYKLVTMNEMFGFPENETRPLQMAAKDYPLPTLAPYERTLVTYSKPAYAYGVLLLQQKLIALGFLDGTADGVYGDGTVKAVKAYQKARGLQQTGVATPELQEQIFAE